MHVRVLVTAATGFVGHALGLDLVAAGHEVSALSRSQSLASGGFVHRFGDLDAAFADLTRS